MATTTVLWAGKPLSTADEIRLRRLVHTLHRIGNEELAADFERFLPENAHVWTPDELEEGAHRGPWLRLDAGIDGQDESSSPDSA